MDLNSLITVTCFIVLILEAITGIFGNIFIISVIFFKNTKWLNKSDCNKILVALAISGGCHDCVLTFNILSGFLFPGIYASLYIAYIVLFLTMFSASSCAWMAATLCFFYFIKITTFSSQIFVWVKKKISKIINWMMVITQMVSILSTSLNILNLLELKDSIRNNSIIFSNMTSEAQDDMQIPIAFFSNCVPMFIMMVTTASTVVSLILHRRQMKKNMGTSVRANTTAYEGVVRIMISFLVFYVIFYVALFIYTFAIFASTNLGNGIMLIIMFSFTPVQCIFLISGTPNLKKAWGHMIFWIKDKISVSTGD
ncbi:taste receptor type 2 member 39-like [Mixophyes fleayi]|uniref:taste receptor type 2 member 39-like n=1 Tax=Mixophyes fleayi TaxID=3061075 RepID=UPI003F4D7AEF